jgi:hypothetical protein|tara:strand:+ start:11608 stop:12147 length:540 start_codon:yes stop_codon:yes gene_type:complete
MLFCVKNYKDKVIIGETISLLNLFWHLVAISFFLFFGLILIKVNLNIAVLLLIVGVYFIFNITDYIFMKKLVIDLKKKKIKYKTLISFIYKEIEVNKCNKLIIYNSKDVHVGKNRIYEIKAIHVDVLLKNNNLISIATFSYDNDDHTLISIKDIKKDAVRLKEIFMNLKVETELKIKEC